MNICDEYGNDILIDTSFHESIMKHKKYMIDKILCLFVEKGIYNVFDG